MLSNTLSVSNLLQHLVTIDSRNPALVADGPGEAAIASVVIDLLRANGLDVTTVEPGPGRPSVIGRLKGSGGGRALLLNAHTDTVGYGNMDAPLQPRIEQGRMYGRGAYDMKAGLAAILMAAVQLAQDHPLRGDLIITAVSDEEHASIGTAAVNAHLQAAGVHVDGAIVTEPTELQLCVAHKGFAWATITTHGRAAHGSRRAEGIDAIAHIGRVLTALEALDSDLQLRPAHPLLGYASLHASLIEGGTGLSTYPSRCQLQIERRTLPGETAESIKAELAAILDNLHRADPQFNAQAEITLYRPPLETPADDPVVTTAAASIGQIMGQSPTPVGATFWMDAALLAEAGIPTVIFGPAGAGAHADVEWVDLPSVAVCTDVLMAAARAFCG